jgi:hypothetical protein
MDAGADDGIDDGSSDIAGADVVAGMEVDIVVGADVGIDAGSDCADWPAARFAANSQAVMAIEIFNFKDDFLSVAIIRRPWLCGAFIT